MFPDRGTAYLLSPQAQELSCYKLYSCAAITVLLRRVFVDEYSYKTTVALANAVTVFEVSPIRRLAAV